MYLSKNYLNASSSSDSYLVAVNMYIATLPSSVMMVYIASKIFYALLTGILATLNV